MSKYARERQLSTRYHKKSGFELLLIEKRTHSCVYQIRPRITRLHSKKVPVE